MNSRDSWIHRDCHAPTLVCAIAFSQQHYMTCVLRNVFRSSRFVTSGYLNFAIRHHRTLMYVTIYLTHILCI